MLKKITSSGEKTTGGKVEEFLNARLIIFRNLVRRVLKKEVTLEEARKELKKE